MYDRLVELGRDAEERLPTALRPRALRGALWAFIALGEAGRQLRTEGLKTIRIRRPPDVSPAAEAGVTAVLIRTRETCLTRAFVRQSWFAAQGSMRDVVIGVSRADGFAAHAWLDGDPPAASEGYVELTRLRRT
jgi:hypothetical protein